MKYIFLAASIVFGITGVSRGMDMFGQAAVQNVASEQIVFDFQYVMVSFDQAPGFVRILLLSIGLFCLYLIWQKLNKLGLENIFEYNID